MILTNLSGFVGPAFPIGTREHSIANMMAALTRDCDAEMEIG